MRARLTRTQPDRVAGDKGYSSRKIRAYLRRRGIACTIPECTDRISGRRRRGETLCCLNRTAYRRRNVLERCFNRPMQNKAFVTLACLRLWLSHDIADTL